MERARFREQKVTHTLCTEGRALSTCHSDIERASERSSKSERIDNEPGCISKSVNPEPSQVRSLVTDRQQGELLKARLTVQVRHPRALLTELEGTALWQGRPLDVVISAAEICRSWRGSRLLGDELWPGESQLVHVRVAAPVRPGRLSGLGDFRDLWRAG